MVIILHGLPGKAQTHLPLLPIFHVCLEEGDSCIYSTSGDTFVFTLHKEDKERAIHEVLRKEQSR